jgi:hypothetical protein
MPRGIYNGSNNSQHENIPRNNPCQEKRLGESYKQNSLLKINLNNKCHLAFTKMLKFKLN